MALTLADKWLGTETSIIPGGHGSPGALLKLTTDAFKARCRELAAQEGAFARDLENLLLEQAAERLT